MVVAHGGRAVNRRLGGVRPKRGYAAVDRPRLHRGHLDDPADPTCARPACLNYVSKAGEHCEECTAALRENAAEAERDK